MTSRGNKYYTRFSCGHMDYVQYFGKIDLLKKLGAAEKSGMCKQCKKREFIKTAIKRNIPYAAYKELLHGKRGVLTGEYKNGKIVVYMTKNVSQEFEIEFNKVFYEIESTEFDNNDKLITTILIKGYNTFPFKEKLKKLGYFFDMNKKCWKKSIIISKNKNNQYFLNNNTEYTSAINELNTLGFFNNTSL